jgi:hypothetical protein
MDPESKETGIGEGYAESTRLEASQGGQGSKTICPQVLGAGSLPSGDCHDDNDPHPRQNGRHVSHRQGVCGSKEDPKGRGSRSSLPKKEQVFPINRANQASRKCSTG